MADRKPGWEAQKNLARMILHDRQERRKVLFRMVMTALLMMAAGLWVIDGWLEQNPWRFLMWWAGCGFLTVIVLLFALYDALAVIREERAKLRNRDDD